MPPVIGTIGDRICATSLPAASRPPPDTRTLRTLRTLLEVPRTLGAAGAVVTNCTTMD